ncbi:MAG: hypothetical protein PXX83_05565, partial [Candidatus Nitrosotalea sp.]|nr:hypothetical protein [Candidatus Nitrosotalea sp.]
MQTSNTKFVYVPSETDKSENSSTEISDEKLEQALKTLATQAVKEKTPSMKDLENILDGVIQNSSSKDQLNSEQETTAYGNSESMIKHLQKLGYLKDNKKWLTKKAFFEIGQKMLGDIIKTINEGNSGFHETRNIGSSDVMLDTTRKFEVGDDIRHLNVP